jgi:hypothetical protein
MPVPSESSMAAIDPPSAAFVAPTLPPLAATALCPIARPSPDRKRYTIITCDPDDLRRLDPKSTIVPIGLLSAGFKGIEREGGANAFSFENSKKSPATGV